MRPLTRSNRQDLKRRIIAITTFLGNTRSGHPLHDESLWDRAYWIKQFGFSRGNDYKGIVTLNIRALRDAAEAGDPYAQLAMMARWTSKSNA